MAIDSLAAALEREHHEIDAGIEEYLTARAQGREQLEPLRLAMGSLRRHIFLEEEFLFPGVREVGLVAPIFVMLREHGEIWDTLDAIDAQLSSESVVGLREETCRQLLAQLERHNSKEEAIIYPQADAMARAGADAELQAFLSVGRLPDGWVCEQAGA
jgi:iron-sulfur cluster repair protein YtfE (RIC family)